VAPVACQQGPRSGKSLSGRKWRQGEKSNRSCCPSCPLYRASAIDTPWAHFEADLAAAKRDWWNAAKPGYLTWVGNVNQEYENYQAAVGNAKPLGHRSNRGPAPHCRDHPATPLLFRRFWSQSRPGFVPSGLLRRSLKDALELCVDSRSGRVRAQAHRAALRLGPAQAGLAPRRALPDALRKSSSTRG
jgi:hypothetical protein